MAGEDPRAGKRVINLPFLALVRRADKDFDKDKRSEPEYEFSKRTFSANRAKRGAYSDS